MAVLYSDRSLPLAANPSKPEWSANVLLAYDFTGVGSLAEGEPWSYPGGVTKPTLVKTGTLSQVTLATEPSRRAAVQSNYLYSNAAENWGMQRGDGDFTIALRVATPATLATTTNQHQLFSIRGSAGTGLEINVAEHTTGWYITALGSIALPLGASGTNQVFPINTIFTVWVQRIAGVMRIQVQNSTTGGALVNRFGAGAAATATLDATRAALIYLPLNSASGHSPAWGLVAMKLWSVGHSDATMQAIGADYWNTEANAAAVESIAIASPATGATIPGTSTISGTYTGPAPTSIQVQHGSGSWVTGAAPTISGGAWSASFALPAGAAAPLRARYGNNTAIVSADVTGVVVATAAIAFTATGNVAVPFRMYQRNVATGAATVRMTGTYSGTPGAIEYSWNGGAFVVLDAAPAGGVFDKTVTLQGPGQGSLVVRHADNTAVSAALASVGVGDIYLCGGQSNHVGAGGGLDYVQATAPAGFPAWKAIKRGKDGVWRENVENATDPFSNTAGALYPVQASASNAFASYFGALATKIMAAGVPCAFIPCALGSTAINSWAVPTPANNTAQLYGAMLTVAQSVGDHRAVMWWQGEADTFGSNTQAQHETALNTLINTWFTQTGRPWFLVNINSIAVGSNFDPIHDAIANVAATNANAIGYADMSAAPKPFTGSVHYTTPTEVNAVADRVWATFAPALGFVPSSRYRTPVAVLMTL